VQVFIDRLKQTEIVIRNSGMSGLGQFLGFGLEEVARKISRGHFMMIFKGVVW
jgi:hypothetical protein